MKDGKLKEWKDMNTILKTVVLENLNGIRWHTTALDATFLLTASGKGCWTGHVVCMGDSRREYRVVVVTETARCRGEDNSKMDRKEMGKV